MSKSVTFRRAAPAACVALIAAITLAGCAGIPGSGGVQPGLPDINQAEQLVQFSAFGPTAGATQEELVRGFLTAANSPSDDYSVAREYLHRRVREPVGSVLRGAHLGGVTTVSPGW